MQLDDAIAQFLAKDTAPSEVGQFFHEYIEEYRELLGLAREPSELDRALRLAEGARNGDAVDVPGLVNGLERAGLGPRAMRVLRGFLEAQPVDWDRILSPMQIVRGAPTQFATGVDYLYFLANTRLRWQADASKALQAAIPESERRARALQPYRIG